MMQRGKEAKKRMMQRGNEAEMRMMQRRNERRGASDANEAVKRMRQERMMR
jgi:hypothetical protein